MPRPMPRDMAQLMVLLSLLLSAISSSHGSCNRPRIADTDPVNGAVGLQVIDATEETFSDMPVAWRCGGDSLVSGRVDVRAGSGRRVNDRPCIESCRRQRYTFSIGCGPDRLVQEGSAWITTNDGRLKDTQFAGESRAVQIDGELQWTFYGELPWSRAREIFTRPQLLRQIDIDRGVKVVEVMVWVYGVGDTVTRVHFSVGSSSAGRRSHIFTSLSD